MGLFQKIKRLFSSKKEKEERERSKPSSSHSKKRSSAKKKTANRYKYKVADETSSLPEIRTGRVEYVDDGFAILKTRNHRDAFLPISKVKQEFIDSVKNHLNKGQKVRYVALRTSSKKEDRVVASLIAVEEFEARRLIKDIDVGDVVEVEVERIRESYVEVRTCKGNIPGRVYPVDLDYGVGTLGELNQSVSEGERFSARIVRTIVQEKWSNNKNSFLRLSRVACMPDREAEFFEMRFGATPFCIETAPRLPRRFDPVAQFVFEAICEGTSHEQIQSASHLPDESLRAIIELLRELNLINLSGAVTPHGKKMYEAIQWSKNFNEKNYEGLFATAAPLTEAFVSIENIEPEERLPDRPRSLMWCPATKKEFMRATDEDLIAFPFGEIFSDEAVQRAQDAVNDPLLWAYLRPPKGRPRYVQVTRPVADGWLWGTLWHHFRSAEVDAPYRPDPTSTERAKRIRLVKIEGKVVPKPTTEKASDYDQQGRILRSKGLQTVTENMDEGSSDEPTHLPKDRSSKDSVGQSEIRSLHLWWEPVSDTLWRIRDRHGRNEPARSIHDLETSSCPDLPEQWWTRVSDLSLDDREVVVERTSWKSIVSYYGSQP